MAETLLSDLRSAREKLCRAQTQVTWQSHRTWLQEALDHIDRIGVFCFHGDWSKYDEPTLNDGPVAESPHTTPAHNDDV